MLIQGRETSSISTLLLPLLLNLPPLPLPLLHLPPSSFLCFFHLQSFPQKAEVHSPLNKFQLTLVKGGVRLCTLTKSVPFYIKQD